MAVNELALFAGAGGGILAGQLLGWRTICAVENNTYAASILVARQNDGSLEPFPIWDDVRTFDGRPWRGRVDVISGGFPCQDISSAGSGAGITGERSGLWVEMARIIGEVLPSSVFVENSPMLTSRGLGRVLGDLAALGYDARWGVLGAYQAGAPHKRDRIWIICHAHGHSQPDMPINAEVARMPSHHVADSNSFNIWKQPRRKFKEWPNSLQSTYTSQQRISNRHPWQAEPTVGRVVDGVAHRLDRLKCLGNGQVPAVARLAWETLTGEEHQ